MNRYDLDIILCHWPLLALVTRFVSTQDLLHIEESPVGAVLNWVFGLVYLVAVIYAIYRVATLGIKGGKLFGWIFGIVFLSFIALPYLFWAHLWEQRNFPPAA